MNRIWIALILVSVADRSVGEEITVQAGPKTANAPVDNLIATLPNAAPDLKHAYFVVENLPGTVPTGGTIRPEVYSLDNAGRVAGRNFAAGAAPVAFSDTQAFAGPGSGYMVDIAGAQMMNNFSQFVLNKHVVSFSSDVFSFTESGGIILERTLNEVVVRAINDAGWMLAVEPESFYDSYKGRHFILKPNGEKELPLPKDAQSGAYLTGMNLFGEVIGSADPDYGNQGARAVYFDATGKFRWLPGNGIFDQAYALNNAGEIVGSTDIDEPDNGTVSVPAFWVNGTGAAPVPLATLRMADGYEFAWANSINRWGHVVGHTRAGPGLWVNKQPVDIASRFLKTAAQQPRTIWDINDDGVMLADGRYVANGVNVQASFRLRPAWPALAVDANRDGQIKFPSEDASDATSTDRPYRFWINDDDDGNALNEEIEVEGSTSWDYASRGDFGIASKRDLEDFARLWINILGISDALKNGDLQLGLRWKTGTVTGSPAINLYRHYESDGGTEYLTDNATAIEQTAPPYSTTLIDVGGNNVVSSVNDVFILRKDMFVNLPSIQTKTFLLFEGAGVGKGQLQILILDKNGNQAGEGTGVWMDIRRINTMFERVKATTQYGLSSDGIDASMPLPHDYIDPLQVPQPTMGWAADDRSEAFVPDPNEDLQNKNYIVFVHGWRQAPGQGLVGVSSSLTYARTMYKRLWHAGYKGRFVAFRWPTFYGGPGPDDDNPLQGLTTYNDSEYRAWKAGGSLAQYVNQLPTGYKRRITAHSMGNIVAGSAFKYGMIADSYALLNPAVPAICYDDTAIRRWPSFTGVFEWLAGLDNYSIPSPTPDAPDSRTPVDDSEASNRALSYRVQLGTINADVVNFYLEADFATSIMWNANNIIMRPHSVLAGSTYGYSWGGHPAERFTLRPDAGSLTHRHPTDPHEIMAYDCKVPTFTVNATGSTRGSIQRTVDMSDYGFNTEHSAQWQWRFQQTAQFYHDLLIELGLTSTL